MNKLLNAPLLDKQLVLVPYWFEQAVLDNGLQIGAVLDFPSLKEIINDDDLAILLALQCFKGINCIEGYKSDALLKNWESSAYGTQKTVLDTVVSPLSKNESVMREAFERLARVSDIHDAIIGSGHPNWQLRDVTRETIFVIAQPGFVQDLQCPKMQLAFTRELVEIMYEYNDRHEVARTPLFGSYLRLIDRAQRA